MVALPRPEGLPGLKLAPTPTPGEGIATVGFPWGTLTPVMFVGHAIGFSATLDQHAASPGFEGPFFWFDVRQLAGQSGGAVVDERGRLVTVIWFVHGHQRQGEVISASATPAVVAAFVRSQS